jgi:hypothetical protein
VDVPLSYVPSSTDFTNRPAANYFRLARDLVWTPDGKVLLYLTPEGIAIVNADGVPVGLVVLDPADPLRYVPIAMGSSS